MFIIYSIAIFILFVISFIIAKYIIRKSIKKDALYDYERASRCAFYARQCLKNRSVEDWRK